MRLKNKVAIITGVGSGQGRGAATIFAREGAKLIGCDWKREDGEITTSMVKQAGGAMVFAQADVSSAKDCENVVRLHANEKDIYGDIPERVLDLIESVGSESLAVAWDSANFVQVGVRPFTDAYPMLRPHLKYLQVKDAVAATGEVTPTGAGDGQLRETLAALRDDGYQGFASLEPHLVFSNAFGGFSGPTSFGVAARAFRAMSDELGIELA